MPRYLPWFNYILHEIDPHAICSFAGLCGADKEFMKVKTKVKIKVIPRSYDRF